MSVSRSVMTCSAEGRLEAIQPKPRSLYPVVRPEKESYALRPNPSDVRAGSPVSRRSHRARARPLPAAAAARQRRLRFGVAGGRRADRARRRAEERAARGEGGGPRRAGGGGGSAPPASELAARVRVRARLPAHL